MNMGYMQEHIRDLKEKEERKHFWTGSRQEILLEKIKTKIPDGSKILEVGCGTGGFSRLLLRRQYDVTVSDRDDTIVKVAMKNIGMSGIKIIKLDIEKESKGKYDFILAFDVLEHIKNDISAIKNIFNMLKPGGFFIFTVPAIQLLYSKHDSVLKHYRRYNLGDLKQKLSTQGFTNLNIRYWNMVGVISAVINKILDRVHNEDFISSNKIFNNLLYHWLLFESKLPLPFGLTLMGSAQKMN